MEKIAVIGAGNWGTTISLYLNRIGVKVYLWEPVSQNRERLIKERENKVYLPGYIISDNIEIVNNLSEIKNNVKYIFIVIPSNYFLNTVKEVNKILGNNNYFVSFTKGLDDKTGNTLTTNLKGLISKEKIAVVSGPSIANEIAKGLPASLVAASYNLDLAKEIQNLISSEQIRVYTTRDVIGVELGGALKNIIAIAAGIVDGLKFGTNAKSALLTRGKAEIERLGVALGANKDTFYGLSGFGDLITTSFSKFSRNRTLGERLANGETLVDIKKNMVMVAEGVRTAKLAKNISQKYNIEMPITNMIVEILDGEITPIEGFKKLMYRTLKPEIW